MITIKKIVIITWSPAGGEGPPANLDNTSFLLYLFAFYIAVLEGDKED
jgi:hypothetical protein